MIFHKDSKKSWLLFNDILKRAQISYLDLVFPVSLSLIASLSHVVALYLVVPAINLGVGREISSSWLKDKLPGDSTISLMILAFAIILFSLSNNLLSYYSNVRAIDLSISLNSRLRALLFNTLLGFGKLYFDKCNQSQIVQLFNHCSGEISYILVRINRFILDALMICVHVVLMFWIAPMLTFYILLFSPALVFLLRYKVTELARLSKERRDIATLIANSVLEALNALVITKAYNSKDRHVAEYTEQLARDSFYRGRFMRVNAFITPFKESVGLLILLFAIVYIYSTGLAGDSSVTGVIISKVGLYVLILRQVSGKFAIISEVEAAFAGNLAQLEKVSAVLWEKDSYKIKSGTKKFNGLKSDICFSDVSFNYGDGRPLFCNLNLCFKKGVVTALIGDSGAGKSTVLNLIMRAYQPDSGSILVDGVDCSVYDLESWSRYFAIVSQDPVIFSTSLRSNLTYGLGSCSEEDINRAIFNASLNDMVKRLPDGLETILGERGANLSHGEKQRISLARAFLKNPDIIIFDEPTSALDAETEFAIQNSIKEVCAGKTVIYVTHRLSTLKHAAQIIFLKNGKVIEADDPETLARDPESNYSRYLRIQGA